MKNQNWQTTTVVPTHGFGMGDVRPQTIVLAADLSAVKRHAAAVKATPATGFRPWSPPVT